MSDNGFLTLTDLTLAYGKTVAVERLNLSIGRGKLVAFLGPSGCGKSATMRAIAGLMKPVSGSIRLDGQDVTRVPANRRQVGLVFQSYALFPYLSVFENVAFGLRLKRMPATELRSRVDEGLTTVGLDQFADRKPAELSGGQQQRVALARSMVMDPKVLLLDEPLSNLDARLRLEMRTELQRVQRETSPTMIFVTHDQGEAISLADTIVVMNQGIIEQIGSLEEIYNAPATRFVADFAGFESIFSVSSGMIETESGPVRLSGDIAGGPSGLAWRPEMIPLKDGVFEGKIIGSSFSGGTREYLLQSPLGSINAEVDAARPPYQPGERIRFDLPVERAAVLGGVD